MIEVVIRHQCTGEGATYLAKFIEENFTGKDVLVLDDNELALTSKIYLANWYVNHPNGVVVFVARFIHTKSWPYTSNDYKKVQKRVAKMLTPLLDHVA